MKRTMTVRTRFAPSPTGYIHIGSARTALFAWLIARQSGGQFILRIEDTDRTRLVDGSIGHIFESLSWMLSQPQDSLSTSKKGTLPWDEGPDISALKSGVYDPYVQSSRVDNRDNNGYNIYDRYAQRLIASGRAYADPYSPEEIQSFRDDAQSNKKAFLYRNYIDEEKISSTPAWTPGCGKPLRLRSKPCSYAWKDMVMGDLSTPDVVVDDIILIKSDGFPTYNFAHIVDDDDMKVTHVIRGQEFLPSTPNYLNIYEALGIDWHTLTFATVPPIMNEQGNKKLSKRDGAKDLLDYREEGYFSFAICNFLASLGWNDGTEQEFYRTPELVEKFSLDHVQRSGARFDERRAQWYNGQVIRDLYLHPEQYGVESLYSLVDNGNMWPKEAASYPDDYKKQVLSLVYDRLKFLNDLGGKPRYKGQSTTEIINITDYFFTEPDKKPELITENKQLKKLKPNEINHLLAAALDKFEGITEGEWTAENIQNALNELREETGQKPGILFGLIRIATTWAPFSPQLNETLALIGKERTLDRIKSSISSPKD